jgi:phosphomannomutase/phosphoglucomutase
MLKINPSIFRAYDIRGVFPQDLNSNIASQIALAFAKQYPLARTIVVAHDTRKSSPVLAKAVNKALVGSGKKIMFLGTAPDPLFYFSIFYYGFDGGVMISGSHNLPKYNGLTLHIQKSGRRDKGDIVLKDLYKIRDMAIKGIKPIKKAGGKIVAFNPISDYLDCVTKKIKLARPLKVVIDSGNGAMGFLPEKVFKKLGCEVKTLYGEFDPDFPHHLPDPYIRKNRLAAKREVLKRKFDIGFVYDGDGDRVAAIDNKGRSVNGDFCLLMLASQALAKHKGPIVHDMRISQAFLEEMKKKGVRTYFCASHHTPIIKKIQQVKGVFGGEVTMHFLFPLDWYLCDEALFASLKIAEIASRQKDFAGYVDSLPRYPSSPEIFIPCPDREKFQIIKKLQNYLRQNHYDFIDVDGARINFPHGWALARAANTTPLIKCRFEGKTEKDLREVERKSLAIFKEIGIFLTGKNRKDLGLE